MINFYFFISSICYRDMVHSHTASQDLKVPLAVWWVLSSTLHTLMFQFIQVLTNSKYLTCSFNSNSLEAEYLNFLYTYILFKTTNMKIICKNSQSSSVTFYLKNDISWKRCVKIIKGVFSSILSFWLRE